MFVFFSRFSLTTELTSLLPSTLSTSPNTPRPLIPTSPQTLLLTGYEMLLTLVILYHFQSTSETAIQWPPSSLAEIGGATGTTTMTVTPPLPQQPILAKATLSLDWTSGSSLELESDSSLLDSLSLWFSFSSLSSAASVYVGRGRGRCPPSNTRSTMTS